MEWYNENWNETINEHLTRVAGTVQSRLSNLLGLLSHQRSCMSRYSVAGVLLVWYHDVTDPSTATRQVMNSYSIVHGGHTYYCYFRKAPTKVVRSRSERGSRCTDEDRCQETENRAINSACLRIIVHNIHDIPKLSLCKTHYHNHY